MKKRILATVLCLAMSLSLVTVGAFAAEDPNAAADALHELGLFSGTGVNPDGSPVYDLDRVPTRNEAVTMLVRLLGKEDEAKAGSWDIPFTDVDEWAKPYVGYAYANKLTTGTSDTTFGGTATVSPSQYLTFVLRALGYQSGTDFQWDKAWELSDELGITHGEYGADTPFSRGDVAVISHSSLSAPLKEGGKTLLEELGLEKKPEPTPTPTPTPSTPADLELKNDGSSTGVDLQKPVESAPHISEVEIPSGKGLKVGESDEGLPDAGIEYQQNGRYYTTEPSKYVQLSDDIIGVLTSEYLDSSDGHLSGFYRQTEINFAMYTGDSITLNCTDYGFSADDYNWRSNSTASVNVTDHKNGSITVKATSGGYSELVLSPADIRYSELEIVFAIQVYPERPKNTEARFHLDTEFSPTYYCKRYEDEIWPYEAYYWYTEKGVQFDGNNGFFADTLNRVVPDVIYVYPDASEGIPSHLLSDAGYIEKDVDKYFLFESNSPRSNNITVDDCGVLRIWPIDSSAEDEVVTITVTSKTNGLSCSIDVALKYYKP